ncbi:succinate--CoA ligase [GDP-forming] subunit beta, mitochondrial [Octopus bimaculoides]|uniref:Succinate--CoA ligase [GDP-forming] subunit beta, mitochondrial n=1 Tax=Octopus bimaculoides TaxID=37653 RepID=A0A0L8GRY3_OCTBM|nr:succinate--CoA ligase [GDP-forming] subunit beta, mitochondrial [Octopus bimaculoides]|eukprot:XP_014778494.1 PREDICTED: succinyl-CoA ligase [GDP-forming] subunit beta, mitochondrial-like [Octopus bimaculoides]
MAAARKVLQHVCCPLLRNQPKVVFNQVRWLNLQEYQSKMLMADYGINVQKNCVADTAKNSSSLAKSLNCKEYVVKAQILAGGRGKGVFQPNGFKGGVHLTKDLNKVEELVGKMLGNNLVTKQTSTSGVKVTKVMIAEALDISREAYLAILMDRKYGGPVIVGSPCGGMDIEEVAAKSPEAIFTEPIDIFTGISKKQALKMASNLGFKSNLHEEAANQICCLYNLFQNVDATQVEVNPFGETNDGKVVCFDAKISFDDNAVFRQKSIFAMEDTTEQDPREVEAAKFNLNYIGMDGNIACLVNGAGLAMATMDIIKLYGGEPANFLDCGGTVTEKQVFEAFKLLTEDSQVKAILVNIFGGIVNCATIANGITNACKSMKFDLPLVVRLEGTNVVEAKRILKESKLPIVSADNLDDAAQKAVQSLSL